MQVLSLIFSVAIMNLQRLSFLCVVIGNQLSLLNIKVCTTSVCSTEGELFERNAALAAEIENER